MIDTNNLHQDLTQEKRRLCLQRAVATQPYFYRMQLPFDTTQKRITVRSVLGINRDFYLTERQANFADVFLDTGAFFKATVYTGYDDSIYNYINSKELDTGLLFTDARGEQIGTKFVDRQYEPFPFHIRRNDKLYAEVMTPDTPIQAGLINLVFKGFNVLDGQLLLTPQQTEQCNDSLAKDVEWQFFKFVIDSLNPARSKSYFIENDNKARLLLGFGSLNTQGAADSPIVEVSITDLTRRLVLTDSAIPLEFIAPRMPIVQDEHIYYLPVEYYLEPYAKLQFNIKYTQTDDPVDVEVSALTRTI